MAIATNWNDIEDLDLEKNEDIDSDSDFVKSLLSSVLNMDDANKNQYPSIEEEEEYDDLQFLNNFEEPIDYEKRSRQHQKVLK